MGDNTVKRFECLEHSCNRIFEAQTNDDLVAAVQRHVAEAHDSFELEDFVLAAAVEVPATEGGESLVSSSVRAAGSPVVVPRPASKEA